MVEDRNIATSGRRADNRSSMMNGVLNPWEARTKVDSGRRSGINAAPARNRPCGATQMTPIKRKGGTFLPTPKMTWHRLRSALTRTQPPLSISSDSSSRATRTTQCRSQEASCCDNARTSPFQSAMTSSSVTSAKRRTVLKSKEHSWNNDWLK